MKLDLNWKLPPYWLAYIVPEDAMLDARGENSPIQNSSTLSPRRSSRVLSYHLPAKTYPLVQQLIIIMRATKHSVIN